MDASFDRSYQLYASGEHTLSLSQHGDDGWYVHKPNQKPIDGILVGWVDALTVFQDMVGEAVAAQKKEDGGHKP